MASTYTANLGVEKPGSGEQAGTWGTTTNTNFDIIDRAINGVLSLSLTGTTTTLTTTDGALSDGGYKVLVLGGSPSGTNTITIDPNDQDKLYLVKNGSGETATFTQGSGGNVSILDGETAWIFADGAGSGAQVQKASFIPELADDTTPQLGGNLDTNSHNVLIDDAHFIGDENGNEQIIFQTTSSAVNQIDVTNAATGNAPQVSATGDDSNINLKLAAKGTGKLELASDLQVNGTTNNWTIEVDSDDHLLFKYNGTAVFALQDNGAVIAKDDITAFGTPT
jgi:hypothetical protein|tara:strand:+ start:165 stop:1004 length:840 start_codon:yes stop_codon:yes gene_type:complete